MLLNMDWGEMVHSVGLPAWNNKLSPCTLCKTFRDTLFDTRGLSALSGSPEAKTHQNKSATCQACEVTIDLGQREPEIVRASLRYDGRDNGSHGRSFLVDLPAFGSQKGDRLEPPPAMPEIAFIDEWKWDTRHRNPLPTEDMGIALERRAIVDYMHCLNLGSSRTS